MGIQVPSRVLLGSSPSTWVSVPICGKMVSPLASKVKFPGDSQSLCQIPRLGNLLWVLELSQQCENLFDITALQLVDCLFGGSMVGLMATSSKRADATRWGPRSAAARAPVPMAGRCWLVPGGRRGCSVRKLGSPESPTPSSPGQIRHGEVTFC